MGDWCLCPNSNMPALYSEYIKYITAEAKGDMAARGGDDAAAAIASSPIPMEKLRALDPVTGAEVKVAQLRSARRTRWPRTYRATTWSTRRSRQRRRNLGRHLRRHLRRHLSGGQLLETPLLRQGAEVAPVLVGKRQRGGAGILDGYSVRWCGGLPGGISL